MQSFDIFSVTLHDMAKDELFARLFGLRGLVITPNPEILLAARNDDSYRNVLSQSILAIPDGIATQFAVAALYDHIGLQRYPGVDLIPMIASIAEEKHEALIFLGGYAKDHAVLIEKFRITNPTLRVSCIDPGMIGDDARIDEKIINNIRLMGSCIVAIALGQGKGRLQGKQERIGLEILRTAQNVRLAIGVGGAVDVITERVSRGPGTLRQLGFEWAWRVFRDPWRFKRVFRAVIIFPIFIVQDTLRQKRFFQACSSVAIDLYSHFFRKTV
ncbi:MAG: WecB/TagA/CpsF family glycosyltransferase [Patescibacteria group bacterium]|jgi:N-acetylglucosaminyldiphosphoundecaprenol N-acetyl-beta-D-mannosaminyltransferase